MKRIMVCTNTWFEELEKMSPADREWLESNSVVVKVTTRLYVEQAAGPTAIEDLEDPMGLEEVIERMEHCDDEDPFNLGPMGLDGSDAR